MRRRASWLAIGALALVGIVGLTGSPSAAAPKTGKPDVTQGCPPQYEVLITHSDGAVTDFPQYSSTSGSCASEVFYGSMYGSSLNRPIVGMAATPNGGGYWLVASDGGVFSFGNAHFYGSTGGTALNAPIVGMASTPNGGGYWLVASDGGIFAYGDAQFYGSMGGKPLDKPIVGIAADGVTGGYWLAASDGGIFAFNAPFLGSMGGTPLNAPIALMTSSPDFGGYRMIGADGGVFDFGDAQFYGSAAASGSSGWAALATNLAGDGYWLFANPVRPSSCPVISVTPCAPPPLLSNAGLIIEGFGNVSSLTEGAAGNSSTAPVVGAATLSIQ